MAQWGRCEYKQLLKLKENIDKLQSADMEKFCRDVSKELAARLLGLVIPRTPVGVYKNRTYTCVTGYSHRGHEVEGKNGGTLRRGWTAKTQAEAESGGGKSNAKAYANSLPVFKRGTKYYIEVINPVEYASYVEFGHRTVNGGWASGHCFLTLSEHDLERLAPRIIERRLREMLQNVFKV